MDKTLAVQALAALAHPVRIEAFRALVVAGADGLSQKALAEKASVAPTNLAFHLKELANAGLVTREQVGQYAMYRAAFPQMNALIAYLSENCCAGVACAEPARAGCC